MFSKGMQLVSCGVEPGILAHVLTLAFTNYGILLILFPSVENLTAMFLEFELQKCKILL